MPVKKLRRDKYGDLQKKSQKKEEKAKLVERPAENPQAKWRSWGAAPIWISSGHRNPKSWDGRMTYCI